MNNIAVDKDELIKDKIYSIRGLQVMLDSDLATLYGVNTKRLNEQVKRNIERFPDNFMFRLTEEELSILRSQNETSSSDSLRSQNVTLDKNSLRFQNGTLNRMDNLRFQNGTSSHGGRRYLPNVFTEQGVSMLSGVLKSETAIKVSIQIINAFVSMRRFISKNAEIFRRLDGVERKHIEYDKKFEKVFDAIEKKDFVKRQGIFYDGQIFYAHKFISDIIRSAEKSIILLDNYIDDSVLTLFTKRKNDVKVTIYTKEISKQLKLDLKKYNSQHGVILIKEFKESHDRFLIIDDKMVYHIGASLKDLGKRWFAFSRFDKKTIEILKRLE